MKKIHNYIMLLAVALAFAGCADDEIVNNRVQAQTGDDVQFGLSLENLSRTVYGDEDIDKDENGAITARSYPIYWVNGDKVQIFSPECLEGRRSAEYKVELPDNGDAAYYAKDLVKTGAYGVQWGDNDEATFYSLYPSGNYSLSTDGTVAEGIFINYNQNIVVDGANIKSDMQDCLMYAKTTASKGKVVNLQYNPITTVFRLTLSVDANSTKDFVIQSVSITSPSEDTYLAGSLGIKVDNGSFAGWGDNKDNIVSATITDKATGGYHTLKKGESVEIPLFLAPVLGLNTEGWKISVKTSVDGVPQTFTKTLDSRDVEAGKIHKVVLPKLTIKPEEVKEWDPATWMVNIPRNVYLSEISIPGTWNSLNVDCQSNTTIKNQYSKGVRAFHMDARWRADNKPLIGEAFTNTFTKPNITKLSVAVGGSDKTYTYEDGNLMRSGAASTFEEYLKQITDNVREDEYMVVFCTFAQNSYNGDRCPSTWYKAISDACASNGKVYDASSLTQNTLVGDVLNHVIVVVNLDASVDSATLPAGSRCLFTYVPMQLPSNHYDATTNHIDELHYATKASSGISMYTSHAQISTTGSSSVNCGDRGYSHPLTKRDALVESFWDWSKSNYGTTNYNHDKWIYLGLGGYIMTSSVSSGSGYDTVENRYAPMIYNRIEAMGKNNVPFYPMGIILMNDKKGSNYTADSKDLGYDFSGVCKEILLLNSKYRLQYDPNKTEDYNPNAKTISEYDAANQNGGNVY